MLNPKNKMGMKQQEITKMSVQDVQDQLANATEQLAKLKLTHKMAPVENPIQIRKMRRSIARLRTELSKRESQA